MMGFCGGGGTAIPARFRGGTRGTGAAIDDCSRVSEISTKKRDIFCLFVSNNVFCKLCCVQKTFIISRT